MRVLRFGSIALALSVLVGAIAGACGSSTDGGGDLGDGGGNDGTIPIDGGFNPDGFNIDGSPTDSA